MIHSTKKCTTCTNKPLSEFSKDASRKDGLQNKCKECDSAYAKTEERKRSMKAYDKSDAGKASHAKYHAKYSKTESGKAIRAKGNAKYQVANPVKKKAHYLLSYAIESEKIARPTICEECPSTKKIEGHHEDYSFPLVVRWLCQICHIAWHKENGPGLNG